MIFGPHHSVETTPRAPTHATAGLRQAAADMIADGKLCAGYFRLQLVPRAPWSVVRIWRGFGWEPHTFHLREVAMAWRALLNGSPVPLARVWPRCAWEPIGSGEYRWRLATLRFARKYAPHRPEARPYERVNFAHVTHDFGSRP